MLKELARTSPSTVRGAAVADTTAHSASHPRTDRRLQEIIAEVGVSENQDNQMNNEMFREHLDGLIIGASRASNSKDERNRYYQTLLEYTLVFPEEWEINATTTTVTASMPNKGSIKIQAQRRQENIEPRICLLTG